MENQLKFLDKVYSWAFQDNNENEAMNFDEGQDKTRPGTGSTRTRPYSSTHTRARPESGQVPSKTSVQMRKTFQEETISEETMSKYPWVDFKQLKHGEKEFFLGHRTLHPEQERPRVRLKEYQRKVFYEEPDEEDLFKEFDEEVKEEAPKPKLAEIPL